jgi:hypothetical protein
MIQYIKDHPIEITLGVLAVSASILAIFWLGYEIGVSQVSDNVKNIPTIENSVKVIVNSVNTMQKEINTMPGIDMPADVIIKLDKINIQMNVIMDTALTLVGY